MLFSVLFEMYVKVLAILLCVFVIFISFGFFFVSLYSFYFSYKY